MTKRGRQSEGFESAGEGPEEAGEVEDREEEEEGEGNGDVVIVPCGVDEAGEEHEQGEEVEKGQRGMGRKATRWVGMRWAR
jgi:hypothetical protein